MSIRDEVRTFFEHEVPRLLAQTPERGDGLRCRYEVRGAGAWVIDFRFPRQSFRPAPPKEPPFGGVFAALEMRVEDFTTLLSGAIEDLGMLLASKRIQGRGDTTRAMAALATLLKGPPLEWPGSLRCFPVNYALMRGTWEQLVAAFPGWRIPSVGERAAFAPIEPPLPYAPLTFVTPGYQTEELLRFHMRICPDDKATAAVYADRRDDDRLKRAYGSAIVGDGRTFATLNGASVLRPPPALLPALAALDFGGQANARPWLEEERVKQLSDLRDLARKAQIETQELWLFGRLNLDGPKVVRPANPRGSA